MSGHEQPELTGADQGHQSDGFLPIWGWWLLALGVAVVTTASLWFARIFHYYAKENPSGIKGLHVGDPPIPFQSTQDKAWLFAAGASVGLLVLGVAYAIRARQLWKLHGGWTLAAKRSLTVAVFLLGGATASTATFIVFFAPTLAEIITHS
jgi:hypothetical protein